MRTLIFVGMTLLNYFNRLLSWMKMSIWDFPLNNIHKPFVLLAFFTFGGIFGVIVLDFLPVTKHVRVELHLEVPLVEVQS